MKLFKHILVLTVFAFAFNAQAQKFNSALEYLEFIGKEQDIVTKNTWKYTKALAHSKSDRNITGKRRNLIKSVERSISKIQKAQGYNGDDYKNKVLKHLRLHESLLKQDYANIVDMKAVAEQSYDYMEAYILAQELADKKMEESQAEYETNFYAFAAKHDINIIESEDDLGKKMKISNTVFENYNKLHLIFFKVYINEIYLWEAIEKSDVSAIQQNASSLTVTAKEGLNILKTTEAYKNDKSLIESTKKAFEYFIDEAENKIPSITDFLILNEDFNSIKETLDKTPEKKRTKEQIDAFNKKVKELNKSVADYNKLNESLNYSRQKIMNMLDNTKAKFLHRHIPND